MVLVAIITVLILSYYKQPTSPQLPREQGDEAITGTVEELTGEGEELTGNIEELTALSDWEFSEYLRKKDATDICMEEKVAQS
jgi:hypothetical protein